MHAGVPGSDRLGHTYGDSAVSQRNEINEYGKTAGDFRIKTWNKNAE